jgi:hypothetical protein
LQGGPHPTLGSQPPRLKIFPLQAFGYFKKELSKILWMPKRFLDSLGKPAAPQSPWDFYDRQGTSTMAVQLSKP